MAEVCGSIGVNLGWCVSSYAGQLTSHIRGMCAETPALVRPPMIKGTQLAWLWQRGECGAIYRPEILNSIIEDI